LRSVCAGCFAFDHRNGSETHAANGVKLIRAKTGEATRSVMLPGQVLAFQQATLYAKVGGT